jgi:hypothetical protein
VRGYLWVGGRACPCLHCSKQADKLAPASQTDALVPVLNVLSYIPYIHVSFFFAARATPVGTHTFLTYMSPFFVRCLRRVPLLGDSELGVHRRCGASLLARVKECVGSADGANGADGADGPPLNAE